MPTFGYEGDSTWRVTGGLGNRVTGSWFTCPESGTAQSITVRTGFIFVETTCKLKCALYKKSDNSLVGVTEEITLPDAGIQDWFTCDFVEPKPVLEAIDYWLVAWGSVVGGKSGAYFYAMTPEEGKGAYQSIAYNGLPNPWNPIIDDRKLNIYCNYTAVAPTPQYALTLASDRPAYWIDEVIQLNGVLTLNGSPQTGLITLYRNDIPYLETDTSPDGSYIFTDSPPAIGLLEYYAEYLIGELAFSSESLMIRRR